MYTCVLLARRAHVSIQDSTCMLSVCHQVTHLLELDLMLLSSPALLSSHALLESRELPLQLLLFLYALGFLRSAHPQIIRL